MLHGGNTRSHLESTRSLYAKPKRKGPGFFLLLRNLPFCQNEAAENERAKRRLGRSRAEARQEEHAMQGEHPLDAAPKPRGR